ncbi:hypothetical protein ACGFOU_32315 [Streptomyces sp. NPDC048595]|uniref:hypothetical protein n=1 Tax=Streptomyces sp. NPDC048595 TaxID=3365576 RepID=UPI0037181F79
MPQQFAAVRGSERDVDPYDRVEELKAHRQECVEDQHRPGDAEPDEVTRIAAVYTARLKELEAAEPRPES